MDNIEKQIGRYILPFNDEIGLLAQQLRDYIRKETKPGTELVGNSTQSLNIGYGFTEKAWDCYCAIIVYSKHINISFPSGASLSDPQGLLKGIGSRIRHIRINELTDVKTPGVNALLMEARDKAFALVIDKGLKQDNIKTIIKQISGVKRKRK